MFRSQTPADPPHARILSATVRVRGIAVALTIALCGLPQHAAAFSYVALGDSLAVGAGDGGGGGYVARYRAAAESDLAVPVTLQNLGVGGSTSADLLATLTGDAMVQSAVAGADLVTVDIGGNDVLIALFSYQGGTCGGADGQDCLRAAVAGFAVDWPAILGELRTLNPGGAMRTMTYYNPVIVDLAPGDGTAAAMRPYLDALNDTIRTVSPAFGIAVAAADVAFNGAHGSEDPIVKGYVDSDHIHPSPLGYDVLGTAFHALGYPPMPAAFVEIPSSITLRDAADPSKRRFTMTVSTKKAPNPGHRLVMPHVAGPQDPQSAGAQLIVYNAAAPVQDRAVVSLPASGWSAFGSNGFRFKGSGFVIQALVKPDTLKVKGKGPGFDYSLDEASQGTVAVQLTFGGAGWCAASGARLSGNPPSSAKSDLPGKFIGAKNAPAPAVCPPDGTPTPTPIATGATPTPTVTPTPTSTATPALPSCGGPDCGSCGSCGDGFCTVDGGTSCGHADAGRVCFSNSTCTFSSCTTDADCGPGKVCVVSGAHFCCAACP